MKRLIIGVLFAGAAINAQAADLPVKAPYLKAPAMAAVYDWTGFYIGVNAGGSVGRSRTSTRDPGGVNENETTYLSAAGAIGGGQIGYNVQYRNFYDLVLGLEADIQASGQRSGTTCIATCVLAGTASLTAQQRLDWFGTARARAGIATGPVLTYVTGGFAYGNVNTSGNLVGVVAPGVPFSIDQNRSGYAIGSGIEAALGGGWTGKVEYLYLDLGTSSASVVTAGNAAAAGFFGNPIAVSSRVRDNIFRAGLNYKIGGNSAYVAPVANWSGFYLGGNVGSLVARNQSNYSFANLAANNQRFSLVPDGYIGGGQIGYNWQASAWVFGVEADFQGSTAKDNKTCIFACSTNFVGTAYNQKETYLGTVRGRVGYSVGSTLFYGTAGFAYGETKTTIANTNPVGPIFNTATLTRGKSGYAAGAGIESPLQFLGLFGPNWTTKTEYLYVDLGRTTDRIATTVFGAGVDTFSTRTTEHIFRTGINYHFNSPVVARY